MTRTERALRDGARYLLDHGWNRYSLIALYSAQAAKAADEGRYDEAVEIMAAMEELRSREGSAGMMDLKRCPFCNESATKMSLMPLASSDGRRTTYKANVVCGWCETHGPTGYEWNGNPNSASEAAMHLWNDRHEEQPTSEA